jgi:hypothetical protein
VLGTVAAFVHFARALAIAHKRRQQYDSSVSNSHGQVCSPLPTLLPCRCRIAPAYLRELPSIVPDHRTPANSVMPSSGIEVLLSPDLEVDSRSRDVAGRVVGAARRMLNETQGTVLIFEGKPLARSPAELSPCFGHRRYTPGQAVQLVLRVHMRGSKTPVENCSAKHSSAERSSEDENYTATCLHDRVFFPPAIFNPAMQHSTNHFA